MAPVLVAGTWKDNAHLIADVARLGYLRSDWLTLDATHGMGSFWTEWRPDVLIAHDLDPTKAPHGIADFTNLPYANNTFDAVVFDPPYKLNGTPDTGIDNRYGVHLPARWQDRMQLCRDGITESVRVLKPRGFLLVKCQDQVVSGQKRWQTHDFTRHAEQLGCRLVDQLHLSSHRPQPKDRRQVHAHQNYSTLLVLKKGAPR